MASSSNRRRATIGGPDCGAPPLLGHGVTAVTGRGTYDGARGRRFRPPLTSAPVLPKLEGTGGAILVSDIAFRYRGSASSHPLIQRGEPGKEVRAEEVPGEPACTPQQAPR